MTYQDPHDLLDRWEMNPRAITMDEAIRQMLQMMCEMYARQNEQEDKYTRQMNLMERGVKAFMEQTRQQVEMFQSDLKALEQTETRSEEIEETLSKALTEALDHYVQSLQQDIQGFNLRFKANEDDIRLLKKQLAGIHPTSDLFVLELATAINAIYRLFGRSQQAAMVLGKFRAELFQKRADDQDDFERDSHPENKDDDIPPDDTP